MNLTGDLARTLLDLAPDPTVIVDAGGTVVFTNAQVERTFGYGPAELVGVPVENLLPERFKDAHPHHRERFASHAKPRPMGAGGTLYGRHKDGHEFPIEISLSPVATDEGLLVVAAVRDATVRQDKEDRLVATIGQRSRFLAAASHDLRQPLQTLNLLNRAANRQADQNAPLLGLIEQQQLALDSMSALLASVLDISKLDSGAIAPSPTACAIQDVLDRVRSDFEPQANDKGIELSIERSTEGVRTDPELLRRLLGNLVSNAIRYTHRGQVGIVCVRRGDELAVEICDTGIGIPQDQLERVFEEFYQVDNGTHRPEGLGLGLSIVQRLQQLLGCGVHVESVVGKGTTFRVTIPRAELEPFVAADSVSERAASGGRVLIVDDELSVADATSLLLKIEGFEVSVVSSEQEALDCMRVFSPEVVVSDFHLRGNETGAGVVAAVRAQLGALVPVIFVTGDTARSAITNLRIENALVLNKPVRAEDLLGALRDQVSAHRAGAT
jgi:two-component system, sensor histidine kinase